MAWVTVGNARERFDKTSVVLVGIERRKVEDERDIGAQNAADNLDILGRGRRGLENVVEAMRDHVDLTVRDVKAPAHLVARGVGQSYDSVRAANRSGYSGLQIPAPDC